MKNIAKYLLLAPLALGLASCSDLFEPAIENIRDVQSMYTEPTYADGILGSAYILMPYSSGPVNDVATDDAVTNDMENDYLEMATGAWTSRTGVSTDNWRNRFAAINYCNMIIENAEYVQWAPTNEKVNRMFIDAAKGEAFGLRALNMYFLLQNYGGIGANSGELLGVTIWTHSFDATVDMNVPRNTFAECMEQLLADVDSARYYLPVEFHDLTSDNQVPARYAGASAGEYNRVFGNTRFARMSGRVAKAVAAQAALLAASPAFQKSGVSWEEAANRAAAVIDDNGGLAALSPTGHLWYTADVVGKVDAAYENNAEVIWRDGYAENNDIEASNFPPSLYGKGRINPTQNLVDAFPMANGFPITEAASGYDPANPYEGRDPRLAAYIVVNGATEGPNAAVINTSANSDNNDGINKEAGYSTRTGYYMRKNLREDCNPNSTSSVKQRHYVKRIRYTEIYLAYAEAANEAWGPKNGNGHSYSAYDVIKAIRQRAGVGTENGDPYLESAANNKDSMRALIRNERRLELCFENLRFWDIRRWGDTKAMNETAKGVSIEGNKYNYINVEKRDFKEYMIYGPLPYDDVLKLSNVEQNQGW